MHDLLVSYGLGNTLKNIPESQLSKSINGRWRFRLGQKLCSIMFPKPLISRTPGTQKYFFYILVLEGRKHHSYILHSERFKKIPKIGRWDQKCRSYDILSSFFDVILQPSSSCGPVTSRQWPIGPDKPSYFAREVVPIR